MRKLNFKKSKELTIGAELEFQLIDPITFDMISRAKDLIRNIRQSKYENYIKPEITQSMIEINSSVHTSVDEMQIELIKMHDFLLDQVNEIGINICGGGTHPFQKWSLRKIFPIKRFKNLSHQYRYLSKRSTVFGLHIHIGCQNAENALYLTHALARFVPHFIAISASSPFYEGVDTGYDTTRTTVFNSFPMSGVIPYMLNWQDFSEYYYKMRGLGIISTMKDFYWDIRPKPEFGTVEIRVCDTPLSIKKAVIIVAYAQTVSAYLLNERPFKINQDLYYLYNYNRFLASRYGLQANFINPKTFKNTKLIIDIANTLKKIDEYAEELNTQKYLLKLKNDVINNRNDASYLREYNKSVDSLAKVVAEQCKIWAINA